VLRGAGGEWQYHQLCCREPTNQLHASDDPRKINRYRNKTIGDRPEFARGLDSYGFAHFKAYTMYMRCQQRLPAH